MYIIFTLLFRKKDTTKQAIYMIYDKLLINIFDQSLHLEKDDDDDELANESLWKVDCDFRSKLYLNT